MISTSLLSSDAFGASDVVDTIVGVRLRPFVDEDAKTMNKHFLAQFYRERGRLQDLSALQLPVRYRVLLS